MDIMEANQYAFAITPHKCDKPSNKHYQNCDKGGCGYHIWSVDSNAYGPGKKIDTNKPFTVLTEMNVEIYAGELWWIVTTLTQTQSEHTFKNVFYKDNCTKGYFA